MDTLIERKKRFTPRRIYGGAGKGGETMRVKVRSV